jgi:LysM repeat protein
LKSITILKFKIITHCISSGGDGAEAIYALRDRDTLARIILEEIAKTGQNIRKWYQRRLPDDTSKDYYFIHRNTGVTEPVIVEYGFLDNAADASFIKSHWKEMVDAIVKGVALYKGIPYTVPTEAGTYTVVSGDTLWSVARKFNVSVDELKTVNNLTTNSLSIGQVLKIPGYVAPTPAPSTGNTYTVQSGDSLWSIANKFGVTVTELRSLNNLTSDILSIGQVLLIPIQPSETPTGTTYTVQSGDNLYSIASRFNTTVDAIKRANNLTTSTLSIGQILTIPSGTTTTPSTTTYTVQSGDNLYSIASAFGTTVDAIKSANNLTSNLLSIGQVLTIPTTSSGTTRTYTVQSGDSLWTIANKFGTTTDAIRRANNLTTDLLSIGQVLIIP